MVVAEAKPADPQRQSESTSPAAQALPQVLSGAEITWRSIELEGVHTVFGYPGGAVIPLYDALTESSIHHVLTRFEQWAGLSADAFGPELSRALLSAIERDHFDDENRKANRINDVLVADRELIADLITGGRAPGEIAVTVTPKSRIARTSISSVAVASQREAGTPWRGSMRMSAGASWRKEKPRAASSS